MSARAIATIAGTKAQNVPDIFITPEEARWRALINSKPLRKLRKQFLGLPSYIISHEFIACNFSFILKLPLPAKILAAHTACVLSLGGCP